MSVISTSIRKIIKIGERSVGITIPKEWLNVLGMSIGSSVEVSLSPGYLLIKPLSISQTKPLHSVRIKHDDINVLSRLIIAGYIEGYDIIGIDVARDLARKAFYSIAMRLPGAIAMDGQEFKVKISVDEINTDLNEVILSMRSTLSTMFDLLIDYFNTGDRKRLEEIIRLDDDLDRLHFLGMRAIKRTAFKEPSDSLDYAIVIKSLEHIGDCLDRVSNTMLKIGLDYLHTANECKAIFKDIFAKVSSYVSKAINALGTNNITLAMKVLLGREELATEALNSIKQCLEVPGVLAITHEAIVAIYEAAEIGEVATLKAIKSMEEEYRAFAKEELSQERSE